MRHPTFVRSSSLFLLAALAALPADAQTTVAPAITTSPASTSAVAGTAVTFTVAATGTAPLNYAWYKEGRLIAQGTGASLALAAVTSADAGVYRVTVSNSAGTAVSNSATLTVTSAPPSSGPGSGGGSTPGTTNPGTATAPVISSPPAAVVAASGAKAVFSVRANGTAPLRYRWYRNGREIDDAETDTLEIAAVRLEHAGIYTARVSNSAGSVTSAPAALTVNGGATITTVPASQSAKAGADVTFTVAATGTDLTYQWRFNGRPLRGATSTTLQVPNAGVLATGTYSVTVSNRSGPAAATAAALTVTTDARLVNIATRGHVGNDDEVLISGFVTRGNPEKKILLRAVGPTLGSVFGVGGALAQPQLTLSRTGRGGGIVKSNSSWGGAAELSGLFAQVGAFPLAATSADSAMVVSLAAGTYTAEVASPRGTQGVALLEVYDADTGTPAAEVVNLSTRALVGAEAAGTLIAGFAISGTSSDTLLIRGVGPSLGKIFGMRRALGASHVAVYDSRGREVAANSVWTKGGRGEEEDDDDDDRSESIEEASDRAGAWRLPRGSIDSALLVTLAPGIYTVHVTGSRGASGIALAEIFELR